MADCVVFVDEPQQIPAAVQSAGSAVYIAVNPSTEEAFRHAGIPFRVPDDYVPPEEFVRVGLGNYKWTDYFCAKSDAILREASPLLQRLDIKPTDWHAMAFKALFDAVVFRAMEIRAIVQKEKPRRLVCFDTQAEELSPYIFFRNHESLYSALVPLIGGQLSVPSIEKLPYSPEAKADSRPFLKSRLRLSPTARWLFKLKTILGPGGMISSLFSKQPAQADWLALNLDYDLSHLMREAARRNERKVLFWDPSGDRPRFLLPAALCSRLPLEKMDAAEKQKLAEDVSQARARMKTDAAYGEFLRHAGHDLSSVYERYLSYFYGTVLPRAVEVHVQALALIQKYSPKVAIVDSQSEANDIAVFEAAKRLNVPRVIYIHGPYGVPPVEIAKMSDYRRADYVLVWGDGMEADARRFDPQRPIVKIVGSPSKEKSRYLPDARARQKWQRRLGLDPDKKTVVCVLSPIVEHQTYQIGYKNIRDHYVFENHKRILSAFRTFPDAQFVVKLFPYVDYRDPIADFARHEGIKNVLFVKWIPFTKLIPVADVVTMDYYSTPTIEALSAGKRTVILPLDYPPEPEVRDIEKSVFLAKDQQQFQEWLGRCLTDIKFWPEDREDRFLKRYGTYLNDGRSAERAYDAVTSIMKNGPAPKEESRP